MPHNLGDKMIRSGILQPNISPFFCSILCMREVYQSNLPIKSTDNHATGGETRKRGSKVLSISEGRKCE